MRLSLAAIVCVAVAGIGFGLYIGSEAVMLDGFYALTSLLISGLYLLAARLVDKPADRRFQYGYAHIEPLVNSVNNLILLVVLLYAFFNLLSAVERARARLDRVCSALTQLVLVVVCTKLNVHAMLLAVASGQLRKVGSTDWKGCAAPMAAPWMH